MDIELDLTPEDVNSAPAGPTIHLTNCYVCGNQMIPGEDLHLIESKSKKKNIRFNLHKYCYNGFIKARGL